LLQSLAENGFGREQFAEMQHILPTPATATIAKQARTAKQSPGTTKNKVCW
jgi:hypothetical protein